MDKIRIGIISPSEIAYRRFMPALMQTAEAEYVGIAYATPEEWFGDAFATIDVFTVSDVMDSEKAKAEKFRSDYGGCVFEGYEALLDSGQIDAVYIPLPPALHYRWALMALERGLHVFVEKPSTPRAIDTLSLVDTARKSNLALHENYMFAYHSQLDEVNAAISNGEIGDVRLVRIDFGFPRRAQSDFRYKSALGGGSLLDCGGYTLKYADMLLGGRARVICANLGYADFCDVDVYGSGTLADDAGRVVQLSFGMDNDYRCSIDVWGSTGTLTSRRILTAPAGFEPEYTISKNGETTVHRMKPDDTFRKSIDRFLACIHDESVREDEYSLISRQAVLAEAFRRASE